MENRNQSSSMKEKLQHVKDEINSARHKASDEWRSNPYVKVGMYVTGAIILVWASQHVFAAFEGAIRQFKKLRKTIKEN